MQQGELVEQHGSWYARYYVEGKRKWKKLGRVADFTKAQITPVYFNFMADANNPTWRPSPSTLLRDFVLNSYFPSASLRGSTLRGYKAIWRRHVEPRLGHRMVRDIRVFDCQQAMDSIIADPKNREFRKATFFRMKSFLKAVFAEAVRCDGLRDDDTNPALGIKIRGGRRAAKTEAYMLDEIRAILAALSGASRVLLAIAAFSALRRGEIVGLMWNDYDGEVIWVKRNICFGERGEMSVEDSPGANVSC